MDLKPSPFAPTKFPDMPSIDGVEMWVGETGVKYKDRPDLWVVRLCEDSRVAGVFTKTSAPGAPVDWSREILAQHALVGKYISGAGMIVNAGNANVFTGEAGRKNTADMASLAAQGIGCKKDEIYVSSTGVIGEPLNMTPIETTLAAPEFFNVAANWRQAAQAISTTDTYLKGSSISAKIEGVAVNICGIVKGSGMIAPDMATMLGFIFTDANISQSVLQTLLTDFAETSFNAITVDSDTSTSDTVLLAATAKANHSEIVDADDPALSEFKNALSTLMLDLAHQVVKDGEGAQKFIQVKVEGAESDQAAKKIAMSIANSPLVKTAIAGEDANWGRIVMAVGKSGEKADRDKLSISFGPHLLAEKGVRSPQYSEEKASAYVKQSDIEISVNAGVGTGLFTVWTCDLTHGYIDINAEYRT